ncbi:MAG: hypothetical protein Q7V57_04235 [Actinomycetota bacterium]|nr:hypothetical protein [Actinomycetota bacterium]
MATSKGERWLVLAMVLVVATNACSGGSSQQSTVTQAEPLATDADGSNDSEGEPGPVTILGTAMPEDATVLDLSSADSAVLQPSRVVYEQDLNKGEFGLGADFETGEVPSGFGVDEHGVVHIVDPLNERVVLVAADGLLSAVPFPEELMGAAVTAFDVAPDGTEFAATLDGIVVIRDGGTLAAHTYDALGDTAIQLELRSDAHGLYFLSGSGVWTRQLDSNGQLVAAGERKRASDGALVNVSTTGGQPVVQIVGAAGSRLFRVEGEPLASAVYLVDVMSTGDVVMLLQSDPTKGDNTQIAVIHTDGSYEHWRVVLPSGGSPLENGWYMRFANDRIYMEVGTVSTVSVYEFDLVP